jgi:hypothetical protein
MKIPHYDEHGQPIGEVDVDLPEHARPRPVHVSLPEHKDNHRPLKRPVLSAPEPIVDVRMHDLPAATEAHLAIIITIAVVCLAAFGALMWVVLGK